MQKIRSDRTLAKTSAAAKAAADAFNPLTDGPDMLHLEKFAPGDDAKQRSILDLPATLPNRCLLAVLTLPQYV